MTPRSTASHRPNPSQARRNQRGFSLIETMVGLVIFSIVLLVAGQFLRVYVTPIVQGEREGIAKKQAESLLNDLSAKRKADLAQGGSFAVDAAGAPVRDADGAVTLNCTNTYCDKIVAVPQATGTALDFVRYDWNAAVPANGEPVYTRAWAVATLDDARNRRGLTVAIFPSGSNAPLADVHTSVVQK